MTTAVRLMRTGGASAYAVDGAGCRAAPDGNAVSKATGARVSWAGGDRVGRAGLVDFELADAVALVREELLEAARRRVGKEVGFVVGPIVMEFAVELSAYARANDWIEAMA